MVLEKKNSAESRDSDELVAVTYIDPEAEDMRDQIIEENRGKEVIFDCYKDQKQNLSNIFESALNRLFEGESIDAADVVGLYNILNYYYEEGGVHGNKLLQIASVLAYRMKFDGIVEFIYQLKDIHEVLKNYELGSGPNDLDDCTYIAKYIVLKTKTREQLQVFLNSLRFRREIARTLSA